MTTATTTLTPTWGSGVTTIDESLAAWRIDGAKPQPEIITAAWRGTREDKRLLDLWGGAYANTYTWMTALTVTGKLWAQFEALACYHLKEARRVLDVGTGTGLTPRALLKEFPMIEIVAADWSSEFLRKARENLGTRDTIGRVALWRVDLAQAWPWPDASFNGATSHFVLPYLPKSSQITLLRQAHRTLQDGSVFLVDFMRAGSSFKEVIRHNFVKELRANPAALIKALLLIPIFTKKADKARRAGLTHDFSDKGFGNVVREIGYTHANLVGEGLFGPNGATVSIWKLVK